MKYRWRIAIASAVVLGVSILAQELFVPMIGRVIRTVWIFGLSIYVFIESRRGRLSEYESWRGKPPTDERASGS